MQRIKEAIKIYNERRKQGEEKMTQKRLGQLYGANESKMSLIISGSIKKVDVGKFADLLSCSADYLLGRTDNYDGCN